MPATPCGSNLGSAGDRLAQPQSVLQQLAPTSSDPREDLDRWRASRSTNFYDATPNLAASLRAHLGEHGLAAIEPGLRSFGQAVATVVDPAVDVLESAPPALASADALGRESQRVEFHTEYARAGRAVWGSGIVSAAAFEQAALLYLARPCRRGRAHLPGRVHRRPRACAAALRHSGAATAVPAAAARRRLRPVRAGRAVSDRGRTGPGSFMSPLASRGVGQPAASRWAPRACRPALVGVACPSMSKQYSCGSERSGGVAPLQDVVGEALRSRSREELV